MNKCLECPYNTKDKSNYNRHIIKKHSKIINNNNIFDGNLNIFDGNLNIFDGNLNIFLVNKCVKCLKVYTSKKFVL